MVSEVSSYMSSLWLSWVRILFFSFVFVFCWGFFFRGVFEEYLFELLCRIWVLVFFLEIEKVWRVWGVFFTWSFWFREFVVGIIVFYVFLYRL